MFLLSAIKEALWHHFYGRSLRSQSWNIGLYPFKVCTSKILRPTIDLEEHQEWPRNHGRLWQQRWSLSQQFRGYARDIGKHTDHDQGVVSLKLTTGSCALQPSSSMLFFPNRKGFGVYQVSGQDAFGATDTCSPAFGITTIPFPVNPNGPPFHHRKLCLCLDIPNVVKNHILIYAIVLYLTYNLYIYNMLYIFTKTYNFLFAFLAYNKPFLAFWILGPHVFLSKSG